MTVPKLLGSYGKLQFLAILHVGKKDCANKVLTLSLGKRVNFSSSPAHICNLHTVYRGDTPPRFHISNVLACVDYRLKWSMELHWHANPLNPSLSSSRSFRRNL